MIFLIALQHNLLPLLDFITISVAGITAPIFLFYLCKNKAENGMPAGVYPHESGGGHDNGDVRSSKIEWG
jgi:hypothetical protein